MGKIDNKWINDDSWQFHIANKTAIRLFSEDRKCSKLQLLSDLVIREDWKHFEKPEEEAPNTDMIRNCVDAVMAEIESGKIKVPKSMVPFIKKLMDTVSALYLQDSAYLERMGGVMTVLLANSDKWYGKSKEERKHAFEATRGWWNAQDTRERTRAMIDNLWACFMVYYTKKKWFADTVDFCMDYFAERKEEWKVIPMFNPEEWYPRKRGAIQNAVMGGKG